MARSAVDRVDLGILYMLQQNARDTTAEQISREVGVAPSTVATRIRKLEDRGVLTGYIPIVDYGKAGFDHTYVVVGTGPRSYGEREAFFTDLLDVQGVINVRQLSTDEENFTVELVGRNQSDVFESIAALNERGLVVNRIELVRQEERQPFDHFGTQFASGAGADSS